MVDHALCTVTYVHDEDPRYSDFSTMCYVPTVKPQISLRLGAV